MTKLSKVKKKRNKDFPKLRTKLGKKLKKAHETKTSFKVKKINLTEQLPDRSESTIVTFKKHNIKELTTYIRHQNHAVRHQGLIGLQEILNKNDKDVIVPRLCTIVNAIAASAFDSNGDNRGMAVKVWEILLQKASAEIRPYFGALCIHLSCAMVHLDASIQNDSLLFLELLLKYTPGLVHAAADTLLKNYINLISRKVSQVSTNSQRTLIMDPSSQLAGIKWHLKLLSSLRNFLAVLLNCCSGNSGRASGNLWEGIKSGCYPSIYSFSLPDKDSSLSDLEGVQRFSKTLLPLLEQCWAEVDPCHNREQEEGNVLSQESADLLSCIMEIILIIWKLGDQRAVENIRLSDDAKWWIRIFNHRTMRNFTVGFPYLAHLRRKKQRKKKKRGEERQEMDLEISECSTSMCYDLNFSIGTIAFFLQLPIQDKIFQYLINLLSSEKDDGSYNVSKAVGLIESILLHGSFDQGDTLVLLNTCLSCYSRLPHKSKAKLLRVLEIVTDIEHEHLWRLKVVDDWISQVVLDLKENQVQAATLRSVLVLKLRSSGDIQNLLKWDALKIRENLSQTIIGLDLQEKEKLINFILKFPS